MKNAEKPMNKPVYLGLLILELKKKLMYEFQNDYIKSKYGDKTMLYGHRYCFIGHILQKILKPDLILQIMN